LTPAAIKRVPTAAKFDIRTLKPRAAFAHFDRLDAS
jgi:hypothetical protein